MGVCITLLCLKDFDGRTEPVLEHCEVKGAAILGAYYIKVNFAAFYHDIHDLLRVLAQSEVDRGCAFLIFYVGVDAGR
jgi:hypothetical protein